MEASALMAIARYRSIPFGEVVMAGDSLADREWQHRGWMTAKSARRQLFASAADAAVALTRWPGSRCNGAAPGDRAGAAG
jgi:uridine phosphorylase